MITRSICIWLAVFFVLALLMNPIFSRENAHEQRLVELDKDIAEIRTEIKRERARKSLLLKQRDNLTQRLARERKLGEEAIQLLKGD